MPLFPIHHTFGPLADGRQVRLALLQVCMPWNYRKKDRCDALEAALEKRFGGRAVTFASGRESLLALLRSQDWKKGDEVIVQGFTCVVVANAIHTAGLTPLFADIDEHSLNLTTHTVERLITTKTRAVICQHTFGIPADTKALRALCDKHDMLLIEDCAHILPDRSGPETIGKYGDAMILSFGRDKAISGVTGGAIMVKKAEEVMKLQVLQSKAPHLRTSTVICLLLYPLVYACARPFYGVGIGKAMLVLAAKLKLLVPILTQKEKKGSMDSMLYKMPAPCAVLAHDQLNRLEQINNHRRTLVRLYAKNHTLNVCAVSRAVQSIGHDLASVYPLQKFPLFVKNAERIRHTLKHRNVHLADGWTGCVICPDSVDCAAAAYNEGSDPHAERAGAHILSLPTHPTMTVRQARSLMTMLHSLIHP